MGIGDVSSRIGGGGKAYIPRATPAWIRGGVRSYAEVWESEIWACLELARKGWMAGGVSGVVKRLRLEYLGRKIDEL